MKSSQLPEPSEWGHYAEPISPSEIIANLKDETREAVPQYMALVDGPESCNDNPAYNRVSVTIPLSQKLLDQFMNGATGYRAHYSVSTQLGEHFNSRVVEAIAPIVVQVAHLYRDRFEADFCGRSLCGPFSKLWFPKEMTDPVSQSCLAMCEEELKVERWIAYWRERSKPWKGLLAPIPESCSILLNGTFVNALGKAFEQNPRRSELIFESGWV